MRELDKSKRYNLEYLTGDEKEQVFNYLKEFSEWKDFNVDDFKKELHKGISFEKEYNLWMMTNDDLNTNAKELFYTLENIQVDCRELSKEKVNNMCNIYKSKGYVLSDMYNRITKDYYYISSNQNINCFGYYYDDEDYHTITYEKFMGLFSIKEENFKKLVEVLNEELTEKAYKETEYEVKYIAEKPNQYQIGIDTFERCEANMTKEECLAFAKGNIDKYNWRNKGQDLEDLEKIISYANWAIKQLKKH